jgi:Flp pilus assembly pilin Flp
VRSVSFDANAVFEKESTMFYRKPTLPLLNKRQRQRGQGMTEYIIIVALISVAAIGVYAAFGQTIRNQTAGLALEMAGDSNSNNAISNADTSAQTASAKANTAKTLKNYNDGNTGK